MAKTRTGSFPIGFRRGWSPWQKNLPDVMAFATQNGFEAIDVGDMPPDEIKSIQSAGLAVGSVDLKQPWNSICSADPGLRRDAISAAAEHIGAVAALGIRNFFTIIFPDDDSRAVRENFRVAVEGFGALACAIQSSGARIVIEGYPGSYPWYPTLCCTPFQLRAFFAETQTDALAINFDPSHLIRMGIDPIRFVGEFAPRIGHVHAKDTQIMQDQLYEFGTLQQSTIADPKPFAGHFWRYTIPGRGCAPWTRMLEMLHSSGYRGAISIELEDHDFNGTEGGKNAD
jgi:sugar phosphate isomerase/epimerase